MNRWNEEIVTQMKPQKLEILGNEKENVGKIVSNSKVWLMKCKECSIPYTTACFMPVESSGGSDGRSLDNFSWMKLMLCSGKSQVVSQIK